MSLLPAPMAHGDPAERRRSARVPLEMAIQLVIEGEVHAARTVLANRHGLVAYSMKLCSRGSILEVRNPENGQSTRVRVAWSWVDQANEAKTIRLALEKTGSERTAWEQAYEDRLQEADPARDAS